MKWKINNTVLHIIISSLMFATTLVCTAYAYKANQNDLTLIIFILGSVATLLVTALLDSNRVKNAYRDSYYHYFKYYKDTQPAIQDFTQRYNKLVDELESQKQHYGHFANMKENLPFDAALLSDMTDRGVKASAMSAIIELAKETGPEDTLVLLKINHERSIWKLQVSGRTICADQIEKILDRVKIRSKDMAKPGGVITTAADKIYN